MLNDAVSGISPTTGQINKYATELGVSSENVTLSESGYRKYETNNYECVVDIGRVGPDYQPGHAHADTFNFVLMVLLEMLMSMCLQNLFFLNYIYFVQLFFLQLVVLRSCALF